MLQKLEKRNIQIMPGGDTKEADNLNELMMVSVGILGLEICICKATDLARSEEFRLVKKREILRPLDVELEILKNLCLTKDLRDFIDRTSITAELSRTELKICFKDIVLLQSGLKY